MEIFLVFAILIAASSADRQCFGVYIGSSYYNFNIIKEGVNKLSDLAMNRKENSLYFIFEDLTEPPMTLLGHLDLNTNKTSVIKGIRNATSITVDHVKNIVYVGGADGIFKINENNIPEQLPLRDDVRDVFFKDVIYYTNGRKDVHKFEDGYTSLVQELNIFEAEKIIFDSDSNIFFTRGQDLYKVKIGKRSAYRYKSVKPNVIETDKYYRAYACTKKGLYAYNKYSVVFDKMGHLPDLKAITFNNANEPIFAVFDKIFKLTLNSTGCFEDWIKDW